MTITTLIIKIKLKFNDINDLINSIKGNTISEADTKKKLNELNEIKEVEIKGKRVINSQKNLLSLFGDDSDNESDDKKDKYYYKIRQLNN